MSIEFLGDGVSMVCVGTTQAELFEEAAAGMFSLNYDTSVIPPTYSRPLVVPGDTAEELLVNWLDELLVLAASERLALSYFTVDRLEEGGVQGSAAGMPLSDVVRFPREVRGVDLTLPPSVVAVPDGWWVQLAFTVEPRLHLA